MNSESRQDSRVPTAELNDDELAKVVGGAQKIHMTNHLMWLRQKLYQDATANKLWRSPAPSPHATGISRPLQPVAEVV
jgi:bacteriocin-like protein